MTGKEFREIRERADMSRYDLAQYLELSVELCISIENGDYRKIAKPIRFIMHELDKGNIVQ